MPDVADELDRRVGAFESAWASGSPDLAAFLPPATDPLHRTVLIELVRVDLEFRRARGETARLERYREPFPALFADPNAVRELAFEEYRLRAAAGEPVHPHEYASRYAVDTSGWPAPRASVTPTRVGGGGAVVPLAFPELGETVGGFRLLAELGRGAFGRVYLAEEADLAGRRVAVKLSTRFGAAEPETLARLQHAHIVPVYSTRRAGPFQLVVMPFLGAVTLADLIERARADGAVPVSARALADTLAAHKGHTDTVPASAPAVPKADAPRAPVAAVELRALAHRSYPEAVLWIGARLAEALAHAHERGVLHRDVKPANVLLTDEGRPMLLDFNLAADAAGTGPRAGGTPAYMPPEQLRQLLGDPTPLDGRADVFALGAVLYELLTGRHPFPPPAGAARDSVAALLAGRRALPLPPGEHNPAVSPAAGAIVLKCLDPDPARRYPSARALADDLERQLSHRPLIHAREPSLRERTAKWCRRHPRLASSGGVAAVAAVLVLVTTGAAFAGYERSQRADRERAETEARTGAADRYRAFRAEAREALSALVVFGHDPARRAEGERRARALLTSYGVIEDAEWAARPSAALLPAADRLALRAQVAELLGAVARAAADRATALPLGPARESGLTEALALFDRAAGCFDADAVPRTLYGDRAEVLARLGRGEPPSAEAVAAPRTAREAYLSGTALVARGRYREAVAPLEAATAGDPRQFWAWFNLGVAHLGLGADATADGCFNACVALEPDFPLGRFNRGLARLNRKRYAEAEDDFAAVLKLKPDHTDARVNRALARLGRGDHAGAEADLTDALARGATETRLYFLRAEVRAARRDAPGAAADRATGLAKVPADEPSWVARGLARADADPSAALADFEAALKLNPRSFPALQNMAFVLSEKLNRADDAVRVLGTALDLYPDALPARAGRAVLLARKGERAAAHRDADLCLGEKPSADVVYQLAGVYALTSAKKPEDARVSLRLLSEALAGGYGFALLEADTDLDPIRRSPEFQALVAAARAVRETAPKK